MEKMFGIMCAKFQIFHKAFRMLPRVVERVITGCAALHNLMHVEWGKIYLPAYAIDHEEEGQEIPGAWQQIVSVMESIRPLTGKNT